MYIAYSISEEDVLKIYDTNIIAIITQIVFLQMLRTDWMILNTSTAY